MTSKTITGIVEWLKGWFAPINHATSDTTYGVASESNYGHVIVEESPSQNSSNAVKSGGIYTALAGKSDTSHGHGNITKDGKVGTAAAKPLITGTGGIVQAGSFGTSSGTFAQGNHAHGSLSNTGTLNSDTTSVNKVVVTDSNGNLKTISQLPQISMDTSNFYLGSPQVLESQALGNLGTAAGDSQFLVNSAINSKIGDILTSITTLTNVELVTVVTTLPTASSSTMNKLYVVSNGGSTDKNLYAIYVTVKNGTTYKWEKIDDADLQGFLTSSDIIDNLTSTATNKALSANQGKALNTAISGKAPTSHASTATTYGASSASNYGHSMASSTSPKMNGTASVGSETSKFARGDHVHPVDTSRAAASHSHYVDSNASTDILVAAGETYNNVVTDLEQATPLGVILQAFGNAIGTAESHAKVKTIELVPKATDSTGAIKITYNDE